MTRLAGTILALLLGAQAVLAETYLLMAEEEGCIWCARWDAEIATAYPNTEEGKAAPLRRYELGEEPAGAELASPVRFTPTFILVRDGREVARLEGYPGEDFFWFLLARMLATPGPAMN